MNLQKYTNQTDQRIEEAIKFLVFEYSKTGQNPKPVIFHSIKVATYLYEMDYETDIIIAALLHDLIEDSEVTSDEIRVLFGDKISKMVVGLSYNTEVISKVEQYKEMFERTKKGGKDLLIIKCADIYQNSFYIGTKLSPGDYFIGKMKYFLEISKSIIGKEEPWVDLQNRLDHILSHNITKK